MNGSPPIPALNHFRLPGLPVVCCEYPSAKDNFRATREKLRVLAGYGVEAIVDLTTLEDGMEPYEAHAHGLVWGDNESQGTPWRPEVWRRPIPDVSTPRSVEEFARLVEEIGAWLEARSPSTMRWLAIHCRGGVGRTGMVAAGLLVRYGWPAESALEAVNDAWRASPKAQLAKHAGRTAPETESQRQMVRAFARMVRTLPRVPTITGLSAHITRGCLLGGAVGDALGAPVEFMKWPAIRARYGNAGITEFDVAYGVRGAITDDTQMTLFTAEGLLRAMTRGYARGLNHPPSTVRLAYLRWMKTQGERVDVDDALDASGGGNILLGEAGLHQLRAPGLTCLGSLRPGAPAWSDSWRAKNTSKGCGTVMRVAPVGLMYEPEEAFSLGCEVSWLTHGHPVGVIAGGAFAMLVSLVARGMALGDAIERVASHAEHGEWAAELDVASEHIAAGGEVAQALRAGWQLGDRRRSSITPADVESLGGAWVAEEALAIGVACVAANEGSFERAVTTATNHSGDSDSTGSMAGQLAGAMGGIGAVPERWVRDVELAGLVRAVADDLALGWGGGAWWWKRWPGH